MRPPDGPRRALFLIALAVGLPTGAASAQENRPSSLARYFPRKDLVAYVEFDGIDAHAEAWKKTAAARLLRETPAGSMLATVAEQVLDAALPPGVEGVPDGKEAAAVVGQMFRSGFAFAINRDPANPAAKPSCIGLVIRGAGSGPTHATLVKSIKAAGIETTIGAVEKPGGRKVSVLGNLAPDGPGALTWWSEKDDLVVAVLRASHADAMIAVLDGKEPDAVGHPGRLELAGTADGFEPVGLAFLDLGALPPLPQEAVIFGLDGLKRVDFRWGFQGEALMTVSRFLAPAPRSGVLAMFDQPTFDPKSLPPLPSGVGSFTVASVDLLRLYDQIAAIARASEPRSPDRFALDAESFRAATGRRLREDVLGRIGPRVVFADVPTPTFVTASTVDNFARGLARVPRTSLLVEIPDRAKFEGDLEALAAWANARFPIPKDPKAGDRPAPALVRRLKGDVPGYEVALSPTYLPLPAGFRPSIVLGDRYAAIGTSPDVALRALRPDPAAADPLARTLAGLPIDLTILSVADTRNSPLPEVLANIPAMIQWWVFTFQQGVMPDGGTVIVPGVPPVQVPAQTPGARPPFRLRLDPDQIPTPEEIRPYLFPGTYSMSVDAQGFRIVTRESMPSWNPIAIAPLAVAAALPAYQDWRAKAEKERTSVNLRHQGLALKQYHDINNHYPPAAIVDKEGKPLLSWRVAILPHLGQQALFDEFKKDEPWDSPHNKALIGRMPAAFVRPDALAPEGETYYRGLSGPGAFFDPGEKEGVSLATIMDGTSNTLAIVEARESVPWTRPDTEISAVPVRPIGGPNGLLTRLGGHTPGGFQALFADGSVRFIRETVGLDVLEAIVTRAGGEVISADSL